MPEKYELNSMTDAKLKEIVQEMGFELCSTSGIEGVFYTTNRVQDIKVLCLEIINDRLR